MRLILFRILSLFFISGLSVSNVCSQFTGTYILNVKDKMPGDIYLFIAPDHTYAFTFENEITNGTWEDNGQDVITLLPDDKYNEDFYIYGRQSDFRSSDISRSIFESAFDISNKKPGIKDSIIIDFSCSFNTAISFDNNIESPLQPVFEEGDNASFHFPLAIRKAPDSFSKIHTVLYLDVNEFGQKTDILKKASVYTFQAKKEFNDYIIYSNEMALFWEVMGIPAKNKSIAQLVNGQLTIHSIVWEKTGDITTGEVEKLKQVCEEMKTKRLGADTRMIERYEEYIRGEYQYNKIPGTCTPDVNISIDRTHPWLHAIKKEEE